MLTSMFNFILGFALGGLLVFGGISLWVYISEEMDKYDKEIR